MSDKADIFFESYNRAVENGYNKMFESSTTEEILRGETEEKQEFINEEIIKWENLIIEALDRMTPKEYINRLGFDHMFEFFNVGARICDHDLPDIFIERLASFGNDSVNRLLDYVTVCSTDNDEEIFPKIMAVRVLGQWKNDGSAAALIKTLLECNENNELLSEEIVSALVSIGNPAVGLILERIESVEKNGYIFGQLIEALVSIGKANRTDEIFKCLKKFFLEASDKMLIAMYLGDYGDGRAVPLLRGYIEKNIAEIDKETFIQVKDAIRRLGGKVDDLKI